MLGRTVKRALGSTTTTRATRGAIIGLGTTRPCARSPAVDHLARMEYCWAALPEQGDSITTRLKERYPANLSVAATKARLFGGSVALCPPSAVMMISASGHALWRAQALSIGQTTS